MDSCLIYSCYSVLHERIALRRHDEDDDDAEGGRREGRGEEEDEEQFRELERMQSMTHEDIGKTQLRTPREEEAEDDDDDEESDDDDDDESKNDDLTGFEGTKIAMVIAQGMRAHVARARLEEEIASRPKDWQPPPAHETFLRKLRRRIYRKQDAPSKETWTSKRQKREEKRRESGREKSRAIHTRGELLKPLPKSIQRKKEGTKLKKSDRRRKAACTREGRCKRKVPACLWHR